MAPRAISWSAMCAVAWLGCEPHPAPASALEQSRLALQADANGFVQAGAANTGYPSGSAVVSVRLPTAANPGDLLIVSLGWGDPSASVVGTPTDDTGTSFQSGIGPNGGGANATSFREQLFYGFADSGTQNVTVTLSTANNGFLEERVFEYAGVQPGPPNVADNASATGTSISVGSVTTQSPSELLFVLTQSVGGNLSAIDGWPSHWVDGGGGFLAEDQIVAPGAYSPGFALDSSNPWCIQVLGFPTAGDAGATDAGPVARLVPADQQVASGTEVTVDGSSSSPSPGASLSHFTWEYVEGPAYFALQDGTPAQSWTPQAAGDYWLRLTVQDSAGFTSAPAFAHVAVAGPKPAPPGLGCQSTGGMAWAVVLLPWLIPRRRVSRRRAA